MSRNLSNDQLSRVEDILRQMDQVIASKPGKNRRRAARLNIRTTLDALVINHSGNLEITIFTRNISTDGIGFVGRRVWKVNERVALTFNLPERPIKMVLCEVTFCRYVRAGLYEAGAQFLECRVVPEDGKVPGEWISGVDSHPTKEAPAKPETPPAEQVLAAAPKPIATRGKNAPAA